MLVQRRRDTRAALRLMRKLLKKQSFAPKLLVTDIRMLAAVGVAPPGTTHYANALTNAATILGRERCVGDAIAMSAQTASG
jgi:transposase-like protein